MNAKVMMKTVAYLEVGDREVPLKEAVELVNDVERYKVLCDHSCAFTSYRPGGGWEAFTRLVRSAS